MGTTSDYFVATGAATVGFFCPWPHVFDWGSVLYGTAAGLRGFGGSGTWPTDPSGYAKWAGVVGGSDFGTGVVGISARGTGVYGRYGDAALLPMFTAGVYGASENAEGVIGFSRTRDGVAGVSFYGTAVSAYSFYGPAARALSGTSSAVTGLSGLRGPAVPNMPTIAAVLGSSVGAAGVIGTSNASVGAYGFSANNHGVVGQSTLLAGFFAGNVLVEGTLTAPVKQIVMPFMGGSPRVLPCMESPEHWFEDFGAARLKRGRALVKLDADFAKVIKRGDYHVFLTPKGNCGGLYVRRQGGASFEVRELGGGKSNGAFSYRIVGRRRDITKHRRFAKVDVRPPGPVKPPRPPRKPTAAGERAFIARLQKQKRALSRTRT